MRTEQVEQKTHNEQRSGSKENEGGRDLNPKWGWGKHAKGEVETRFWEHERGSLYEGKPLPKQTMVTRSMSI